MTHHPWSELVERARREIPEFDAHLAAAIEAILKKQPPAKKKPPACRLMNSATMPQPGAYQLRRLAEEDFAMILRAAHQTGILVSYIGYAQTVSWLRHLTGVDVPMSRDLAVLDDGDALLIIRLDYRVRPQDKGAVVPEEWEYYLGTYHAEKE